MIESPRGLAIMEAYELIEGINTKTKLAFAVAELAGIGRGKVIKIIDRYTGTDTAIHKWAYLVGERGAKSYTLITKPTSSESGNFDAD